MFPKFLRMFSCRLPIRDELLKRHLSRGVTRDISLHFPKIKQAFGEVLSRVPIDVFLNLVDGANPVALVQFSRVGLCTSFSKQRNKFNFGKGIRIIVIDGGLNNRPLSVIVGVLAHEIAHAYLHCYGNETANFQHERESNALLHKWGFGKEYFEAKSVLG